MTDPTTPALEAAPDAVCARPPAAEPCPEPSAAAYVIGARPAPPVHTRFQKGQTGNRTGAPPRPPLRTAQVEALMRREFEVVVEGRPQRLPLSEALLLQLAHRALSGEAQATSELIRLMGEVERVRGDEARRRADRVRAGRKAKADEAARRARAEEKAAEARAGAEARARARTQARVEAGSESGTEAAAPPPPLPRPLPRPAPDPHAVDFHEAALVDAALMLELMEEHPDDGRPGAWGPDGLPRLRVQGWALEAARSREPDAPYEDAAAWRSARPALAAAQRCGLLRRQGHIGPLQIPRWAAAAAEARNPEAAAALRADAEACRAAVEAGWMDGG